jgi:hypothetical protein
MILKGAKNCQFALLGFVRTLNLQIAVAESDHHYFGLETYRPVIETEFGANGTDIGPTRKVLHIIGPPVGKINNNKTERFHGSVKGRLKTMGHLNSDEGAETFGEGYEIHYNFIRGHQSLNGRTPKFFSIACNFYINTAKV